MENPTGPTDDSSGTDTESDSNDTIDLYQFVTRSITVISSGFNEMQPTY